jgi:hypothetical protein
MDSTHFRKSTWQMSKDQVRATEASAPAYESENALGYRGELMGTECMVYFEFDAAGLARAAYMIDDPDDAKDIEDYNRLKSLLTKKYGEPKDAGMVLTKNVYRLPKIDPTIDLETALAEDVVRLKTWWQTEDTYVALVCRGQKGNVQLAVMYNSLKSRTRAERETEIRDLELL